MVKTWKQSKFGAVFGCLGKGGMGDPRYWYCCGPEQLGQTMVVFQWCLEGRLALYLCCVYISRGFVLKNVNKPVLEGFRVFKV